MERRYFRWRVRWFLLAVGGMGLGAPHWASAQSSPPPSSAAPPPAAAPSSAAPPPAAAPASAAPPPAAAPSSAAPPPAAAPGSTARNAQLEERIRQLEAMVNKLSTQVNRMPPPGNPPSGAPGTADPDGRTPASAVAPSARGGAGSPGQSLPPDPPPAPRFNMPATLPNIPSVVRWGSGFEITTPDNEYQWQFHNLTQADYRGFQQGGQTPLHDTFLLPRQWFIFAGRLTKPYEYFVSLANTNDAFTVLWCWLNIHYDDRLQLRFGRVYTPFGYEWWQVPTAFMLTPERSIWANNFTPASDLGAFAWGQLFKKRVDYAVGIFNGARNQLIDNNNEKDLIAFLQFKPFLESDIAALKYLTVGGSVDTGNEFNAPIPSILRTSVQTGSATSNVGPAFLTWNSNVRESGWKALWNMHVAYYYNHLSVYGEWQSGFENFAFVNTPRSRTQVPIEGFYVNAGYFLTGETVGNGRNVIQPKRDFDLRKGKRGPGAIELVGRYSMLDLGSKLFTAGLADPNLWANRVYNIDVGVNWYLTRTIKMYFGWEHDVFNQPVLFAPGRRQLTSDQAWVRFQIFF
jgi:phosphate-selective porin OprO and OprP